MEFLYNVLTWYGMGGIFLAVISWIYFVIVMTAKKYQDQIPQSIQYLFYIIVIKAYIFDILFDTLYGGLLFGFKGSHYKRAWANKDFHDLTFTRRLKTILREETSIKKGEFWYNMAIFICRYILNPFDKNHCGRNIS